MKRWLKHFSVALALFAVCSSASAQESATILTGAELTRIVPTGFYFQGLSAPTQMRNAAKYMSSPCKSHFNASFVRWDLMATSKETRLTPPACFGVTRSAGLILCRQTSTQTRAAIDTFVKLVQLCVCPERHVKDRRRGQDRWDKDGVEDNHPMLHTGRHRGSREKLSADPTKAHCPIRLDQLPSSYLIPQVLDGIMSRHQRYALVALKTNRRV